MGVPGGVDHRPSRWPSRNPPLVGRESSRAVPPTIGSGADHRLVSIIGLVGRCCRAAPISIPPQRNAGPDYLKARSQNFGVRRHDCALERRDMSRRGKAATCRRSPRESGVSMTG